jgi:hypothetical protein
MARTDTDPLHHAHSDAVRQQRLYDESDTPERVTATEAKQGRWGTHVLTVLIVSSTLAVLAMAYFVLS